MALVVPDLGEQWLLDTLLRRPIPTDYPLWLGLWKNNVPILKASVLADLTPADFAGYAIVQLPRTGWSDPQDVGGVAQMFWSAGVLQWEPTAGAQVIYGVYVTDPSQSVLLWGEALANPYNTSPGNPVGYLPTMRLNSLVQP